MFFTEWWKRRQIKAQAKTQRFAAKQEAETVRHNFRLYGMHAPLTQPWGLPASSTSRRRRRSSTRRSRTHV